MTLMDFLVKNPSLTAVPVRWGDMDAYQHVNNTVYFKYFEDARIQLFRDLNACVLEKDPGGTLCPASAGFVEEGGDVGPILGYTDCQFKFPCTYPDKLVIGAHIDIASMSSSKLVMHYTAWSRQHQRVVASGTGTILAYNYGAAKVSAFPEMLVDAMHTLHTRADTEKLLELEAKLSDMSFDSL
jgi:acyl-CoA thioester hydrolase